MHKEIDLEPILGREVLATLRLMLADGFTVQSVTKHLPSDFPEEARSLFTSLAEELIEDPHTCVKCGELCSKKMCMECFRNSFDYFRFN
jgi:hypothetical protein